MALWHKHEWETVGYAPYTGKAFLVVGGDYPVEGVRTYKECKSCKKRKFYDRDNLTVQEARFLDAD